MHYLGIVSAVGHLKRHREHLRGKYHCTVDLLFHRFRNVRRCSTKFSAPSTNAHF